MAVVPVGAAAVVSKFAVVVVAVVVAVAGAVVAAHVCVDTIVLVYLWQHQQWEFMFTGTFPGCSPQCPQSAPWRMTAIDS